MAKVTKLAALKKAFMEAKDSAELFTEYQVEETDNITLSLKYGTSGVSVNTNVRLRQKFIIEDEAGDVKNFPVGTGAEIRGATLVCFCLLTHTSAMGDSKALKISITLRGGKNNFEQTIQQTVAGNDSIMFRIEVFFTR